MSNLRFSPNTPVAIAHQTFQDIDELEAISRANGQRDLRLTQLSLGRLHCEFFMVDFGEARLTFAKPNCPVKCIGPKVKDCLDFSFTLDNRQPTLLAHGYHTSHVTISGLDAHLETHIVVPPQQVFFTLQVKRNLLEDCAEALNREDLDDRYWRHNFVYAPRTLPSVQVYLQELLTVIQKQPRFLQQPQCKRLVLEDLIPLLVNALPFRDGQTQGITSSSRIRLVLKAEDYIQAHLQEPLTIQKVCEALHTSKRVLFSGFEEVFGLGPMAYVKVQRLQAVRRALQEATPETTSVSGIAQSFGFWSAGHFARDYKTMFGESPRETLKTQKK